MIFIEKTNCYNDFRVYFGIYIYTYILIRICALLSVLEKRFDCEQTLNILQYYCRKLILPQCYRSRLVNTKEEVTASLKQFLYFIKTLREMHEEHELSYIPSLQNYVCCINCREPKCLRKSVLKDSPLSSKHFLLCRLDVFYHTSPVAYFTTSLIDQSLLR